MVAASIGRKVFAWKAGTGKGREKGKGSGKKLESKKASGSARPGKGGVQTLGGSYLVARKDFAYSSQT